MTIAQVRQALSDAADGLSDLRAAPYMPDQINPAQAVVLAGDWDPRYVMAEGKTKREFIVRVFAGRTADTAAHKLLDTFSELSGATSMVAAIHASTGLNGANGGTYADYAEVVGVSGVLTVTVGTIDYLAMDWTTEVVFS